MATQIQVKTFIETIAPIAIFVCNQKPKKVLPSVCIAQACCESAYGTSTKMVAANAVFGIKVGNNRVHFGKAWKDKVYSTKTKECYDGKTYTNIVDMFRAYDCIRDAVEDYYDMLGTCSRYAKCIGETDYTKSITAIKNGGYATDPDYITTITSIIKKYDLTRYDGCMTGKVLTNNGENPYEEPLTNICYGMKSQSVKWIQFELNQKGYSLSVDGIFGVQTLGAVIAFQKENALKADGIVGAVTRQTLKVGNQ